MAAPQVQDPAYRRGTQLAVLTHPGGENSSYILSVRTTCLSFRRLRWVAGPCCTWLDVASDQLLRDSVWLEVAGPRWPLAAN
jgi:hypothetical protein